MCHKRWIRILLVVASHFVSPWYDPPQLTGRKKNWVSIFLIILTTVQVDFFSRFRNTFKTENCYYEKWWNCSNIQEVKNQCFLISTRQNNVRIFVRSAYVAFNKATNGQTDTKREKEKNLSWMSPLKIAVEELPPSQRSIWFPNSIFAREGAFQLRSSTVTFSFSNLIFVREGAFQLRSSTVALSKVFLLFVFYISVCPFVALLKATYADIFCIVLSSRYQKAFIFDILCVLICFLEC